VPFEYENKQTPEEVQLFLEDKKLSYSYQESKQNSSADQAVPSHYFVWAIYGGKQTRWHKWVPGEHSKWTTLLLITCVTSVLTSWAKLLYKCQKGRIADLWILDELTALGWTPLQRLTVRRLVQKLTASCGTRRNTTIFTIFRYRVLFWARWIHSIAPPF